MKKFKKILALALSLAMVLGMSVTSFAAPQVGKSTDKGDIVVHGIEETNLEVKAYPIMLAKYDANGNFVGYNTDALKGTQLTVAMITGDAPMTKAALDSIPTEGKTAITLKYDAATKAYKTEEKQSVGMYLIVVPSTDSTTYSRAVASIYYSNGGSDYVLNNADLTMTTQQLTTEPWVKKDVDVSVEKKVEGVQGNTANVGDVLNYEVVIPVVPTYNGPHPVLKITDVLSKGLTYQNDAKIYLRTTDEQTQQVTDTEILQEKLSSIVATKSVDKGTELTVNFVETAGEGKDAVSTYLLSGDDYAGKTVVVKYSAKLNADAERNGVDNGNSVALEYTKDSSVKIDDPEETPKTETKTHTYTFDIDGTVAGSVTESIITKYGEEVDSNNVKQPLEGATFTLYKDLVRNQGETDEAYLARILADGNKYKNYDNAEGTETEVVVTTNAAGKVKISGLAAGTYYLKETSAPTGYTVNDHAFKIEIKADTFNTNGELTEWSIKIDGEDIATFTVTNNSVVQKQVDTDKGGIEIQNTKIASLPSTGGIGTTIFTIGGCAIMILAAALYFATRRKSAR